MVLTEDEEFELLQLERDRSMGAGGLQQPQKEQSIFSKIKEVDNNLYEGTKNTTLDIINQYGQGAIESSNDLTKLLASKHASTQVPEEPTTFLGGLARTAGEWTAPQSFGPLGKTEVIAQGVSHVVSPIANKISAKWDKAKYAEKTIKTLEESFPNIKEKFINFKDEVKDKLIKLGEVKDRALEMTSSKQERDIINQSFKNDAEFEIKKAELEKIKLEKQNKIIKANSNYKNRINLAKEDLNKSTIEINEALKTSLPETKTILEKEYDDILESKLGQTPIDINVELNDMIKLVGIKSTKGLTNAQKLKSLANALAPYMSNEEIDKLSTTVLSETYNPNKLVLKDVDWLRKAVKSYAKPLLSDGVNYDLGKRMMYIQDNMFKKIDNAVGGKYKELSNKYRKFKTAEELFESNIGGVEKGVTDKTTKGIETLLSDTAKIVKEGNPEEVARIFSGKKRAIEDILVVLNENGQKESYDKLNNSYNKIRKSFEVIENTNNQIKRLEELSKQKFASELSAEQNVKSTEILGKENINKLKKQYDNKNYLLKKKIKTKSNQLKRQLELASRNIRDKEKEIIARINELQVDLLYKQSPEIVNKMVNILPLNLLQRQAVRSSFSGTFLAGAGKLTGTALKKSVKPIIYGTKPLTLGIAKLNSQGEQ